MTDTTSPLGWAPAPGSVARHNWPLALRWLWWLAHRPALIALAALVVFVGVKAGPVAPVALVVAVAAGLVGWWRV
jgi:hypothetical protein